MGEKILLNQFCCNPLPTTGPVYNSFKANDAPSFNISFFFYWEEFSVDGYFISIGFSTIQLRGKI